MCSGSRPDKGALPPRALFRSDVTGRLGFRGRASARANPRGPAGGTQRTCRLPRSPGASGPDRSMPFCTSYLHSRKTGVPALPRVAPALVRTVQTTGRVYTVNLGEQAVRACLGPGAPGASACASRARYPGPPPEAGNALPAVRRPAGEATGRGEGGARTGRVDPPSAARTRRPMPSRRDRDRAARPPGRGSRSARQGLQGASGRVLPLLLGGEESCQPRLTCSVNAVVTRSGRAWPRSLVSRRPGPRALQAKLLTKEKLTPARLRGPQREPGPGTVFVEGASCLLR
jgi:hypothetical protein